MQIHELNNFTGTLGSGSYLAIDDGNDTGKISKAQLFAATEARIDNIIAGPAPSAEEIVDARLGDDGVTYPSLGDAIRDQFSDVKSAISVLDKRTISINVWDEDWELGGINGTTGANGTSTNQIRSKGYIKVKPNTTYYFKLGTIVGGGNIFQYDSSKAFLSGKTISNISAGTFTTDASAGYIRMSSGSAYGTTYNNDISINYPSTFTGYYPYAKSLLEVEFDALNSGVADASAINNNAVLRTKLANSYQNTIKRVLSTGDDLNNYHTPDVLYVLNGTSNTPNNTDNWIVQVIYAPWMNGARYKALQIAYNLSIEMGNCHMFIREYDSYADTWQAWRYVSKEASLADKKIVFMGDSTYAVTGGTGKKIPGWVATLCGCTTYQCAFGGTRMSDSRSASDTYKPFDFPNLVDSILANNWTDQDANLGDKDAYYSTNLTTLKGVDWSEVDILCVEYGTNDYTGDVPIGTATSDRTTVSGALIYCLDKLLTAYPDLKIFVDGIRYRAWLSSGVFVDDAYTHLNTLGKTLVEYADGIKASADSMNLKYADNLRNYGWNKYNRGTYFTGNDITHFNANGTAFASKVIVDHLISMGSI